MERKVLVCLFLAAVSTSGIRLLFEPFSEFPNKNNSRAECPDKRTCDGNKTCCELRTGKYGCCDMPEAVCCADRIHCCPKATTCDLQRNKCVHYNGFVTNMHKHEDEDDQSEDNGMKQLVASRIICPDIKSYCLDNQTCCLLAGGMYGCCPLPKAVCCSDKEHCCPMGTKCDDASGSCLIKNGGEIVPWFGKEASMTVGGDDDDEVEREDCPDEKSYCMDGQTCCLLSGGTYGCCPYPMATCCSDMMHCCPSGYVCDSTGQFCTKDSVSFPSSAKINAMSSSSSSSSLEVKNVICPDARYCKDDETCCLLGSDEYGCCPYKEAVCCDDNTHCCPHGYVCDPSGRACKKGSTSLPWSVKVESMSVKVQRVVCPDPAYYCNDGETCCLLKGGMYGCCPYPKAVCCADLEHCCPEGYTCDPSGLRCNKESSSSPSFLKLTAFNSLPLKHKLMCPDKATYCLDYQTCCLMVNGKYGCCEYKEAECCNDRLHCCPKGYKCDSTGTMCIKGSMTLASSPKVEATSLSTSLKRIVCPDEKSYCQDNQTCCPLRRGKFGCCIYPSAVCCEDKQHCCPQGYECNTAGQFCTNEFLLTTSSRTMESKIIIRRKDVVCPDGKVTCASDNTCCIMKNLKYGCCPMPAATCCADGEHCCPTGFKCKESSGTCINGSVSLPSVGKIDGTKFDSRDSGKIAIKNMMDDIVICDSTSFCQVGQTCCLGPDHTFKCCPIKSASCCKDGVHCCKYWCIPGFNKCLPGAMKHLSYFFINRTMEEPLASLPAKKVNWCDESLALYCPSGFDCNMNEGSCIEQSPKFSCRGNDLMASSLIEGQESFQGAGHEISKVMNDVMCADNSSCPDETTCCLQLDGHFTCCQFKNAICCKDQSHCCPQGYKCDLHEQTCTRVSDDVEENSPWGFHGHTRANSSRDREGMRCSKKQGGLCPLGHKCCDEGEDSFCCVDDGSVCCNGYCCPSNQKCGDEKYTCI